METVRWEELISEDNWDTETRSDIEMEQNKEKLSKDAVRRSNADHTKESRVIPHPDVGWAVPRTEASLTVKLAKKKRKSKRSKKSLDGLYEVLAPGSSVIKTDAFTKVIKEPGKREVTNGNLDLAKFGTKAVRQTDLQIYANSRPKIPSGKITEDLINQHAREARKKLEGNTKMKHKKIADDVSAVSSIHSNVTRALRIRMPVKPKKTVVPVPPQPPTESVTDFAPPMELPLTSIVIAEPPTRPKRKAATKATESFQPTQKRKRSSPSITESDESLASTQTCPLATSSSSAPSRQKRRQSEMQLEIKF